MKITLSKILTNLFYILSLLEVYDLYALDINIRNTVCNSKENITIKNVDLDMTLADFENEVVSRGYDATKLILCGKSPSHYSNLVKTTTLADAGVGKNYFVFSANK